MTAKHFSKECFSSVISIQASNSANTIAYAMIPLIQLNGYVDILKHGSNLKIAYKDKLCSQILCMLNCNFSIPFQYLLYSLMILSAKSESNHMLLLGSIGSSLTPAQKLQSHMSSKGFAVKGLMYRLRDSDLSTIVYGDLYISTELSTRSVCRR